MHLPELNLRAGRLLHFSAAVLAIIWTLHGPPDATLTSYLRLAAFCYLVIIAPQPGINLAIVLPLITVYEPFGLGRWLGLFMYTPLFWAIYSGRMFSSIQVAVFITFGQVFVITPWIEPFLDYFQLSHTPLLIFAFVYWLVVLELLKIGIRHGKTAFGIIAIVAIPTMEWLRSHLEAVLIPYQLTAHALSGNSSLAQWAEATGVIGLSVLVCAVSALAARAFSLHVGLVQRSSAHRQLAIVVAIVLFLHVLGAMRSYTLGFSDHTIKVAAIQLDAPGYRTPLQQLAIVDRLYQKLASRDDLDLVILPETSAFKGSGQIASEFEQPPLDALVEAAVSHHLVAPVLVGTLIAETSRDGSQSYRNAAIVFAGDTELASRDKRLFAPLGETTLFQNIPFLDLLGVRTTPQSGRMKVSDPGSEVRLPSGVVVRICICIEQMIPQLWRFQSTHIRPGVLVCLGDTSRLGFSKVERLQSRAARVLRAIEQRRPLVFVANGGSEWVDDRGQLVDQLSPEEEFGIWSVRLGSPDSEMTRVLRYVREDLFGIPILIPVMLLLIVLFHFDDRTNQREIP